MMLILLLSELTRLKLRLLVENDGLHIQAPAEALTDELRQAMTEHKAALLRFARFPYVQTIDGLGILTGHLQEQDVSWVAPEHQEALRYKIGVISFSERILRFYRPRMVLLARPEAVQVSEQRHEDSHETGLPRCQQAAELLCGFGPADVIAPVQIENL